eukprot:GHVS01064324.1.p1 GENE.GHVS01064324.1~~GHVS01064324.1.p1  ORF type:complete len:254 (+),score=45.13 GHVS01064324.1:33-794(+)
MASRLSDALPPPRLSRRRGISGGRRRPAAFPVDRRPAAFPVDRRRQATLPPTRPHSRPADSVQLVDDYGRITPEMAQTVSRMSMDDVSNLLLNIQRWIQQAPAVARTVLTECPELCEALLEAQMCTGMMQQQFRAFHMLSANELQLAERMAEERTSLQNAMSSLVLLTDTTSSERKRRSMESSEPTAKRPRAEPPSAATLKLADEVMSNDDMLNKMLNTPLSEILSFPEEHRNKVMAVRLVLRDRGYAVSDNS